jgi:Xaa-Pro dipeptidase
MLEDVFGSAPLVDVTEFLHTQRARKTDAEIEKLRIANEVASFGLRAFSKLVASGITGVELFAEVERAIMVRGTGHKGAKRVRAFAQVATGSLETSIGYRPMEISSLRKMESGDLALLELVVVVDGFWSDRTRVRVADEHSKQMGDVFEIVSRAQSAAIERVRASVSVGDVDEAARSVIRDAGYVEMFPHVTGHGVGLRYHEPSPIICPGGDVLLEQGMVHSVEPGIYFPEMGGVRLEDNAVVTETGCEVLGPFERDLV